MILKLPYFFLRLGLLSLGLCVSGMALADVTLPKILNDGMVLQRSKPISIWGWASAETSVQVQFAKEAPATAQVVNGRWQLTLKPRPAGGPYTLTVKGHNQLTLQDIYIGDVWLASGQSNMELPMRRVKERFPEELETAKNSLIRLFTVPKKYEYQSPVEDVAGGQWQAVSPETIAQFSAVAYFFAKDIQARYDVPVGVIVSAYGGASAEGWMSQEALRAYPHYFERTQQLADPVYLKNALAEDERAYGQWFSSLDQRDAGLLAEKKWFDPNYDFNTWPTVVLPSYWEDAGVGNIDGSVWFQKEFLLPNSATGKEAKLVLGRLVDADTAYINGVKVGNTTYQYPPRRYPIPAELLRPGKNRITVRLVNTSGKGGFVADNPYAIEVGGETISLTGAWHYKVGAVSDPLPEPKCNTYANPLGFYNAMLAPLLNLHIKGVIWYQGESNTGKPTEYQTLFPDLIRDWRQHWGIGDFPFIYVQLANFMDSQPQPVESKWAETRAAQTMALAEPNTAMAVAIDVGEWNDIHPLDKETVGKRLALAARKVAYGEKKLVASGPMVRSVSLSKHRAVLRFDSVGGGLTAKGDALQGFAVADKTGDFVWANAKIKGKTVIVWSDSVNNPVRVRYAWADNPDKANLYNREGLPAVPFEMSAKP